LHQEPPPLDVTEVVGKNLPHDLRIRGITPKNTGPDRGNRGLELLKKGARMPQISGVRPGNKCPGTRVPEHSTAAMIGRQKSHTNGS
jgi:hypothetical protein